MDVHLSLLLDSLNPATLAIPLKSEELKILSTLSKSPIWWQQSDTLNLLKDEKNCTHQLGCWCMLSKSNFMTRILW